MVHGVLSKAMWIKKLNASVIAISIVAASFPAKSFSKFEPARAEPTFRLNFSTENRISISSVSDLVSKIQFNNAASGDLPGPGRFTALDANPIDREIAVHPDLSADEMAFVVHKTIEALNDAGGPVSLEWDHENQGF